MSDGSNVTPIRTGADFIAQYRERMAAEGEALDAEAKRLTDGIIMTIAAALHQSDMIKVDADGHYLRLALTKDGIDYLKGYIEPPIRGALSDQRQAGQLGEMRDRLQIGGAS